MDEKEHKAFRQLRAEDLPIKGALSKKKTPVERPSVPQMPVRQPPGPQPPALKTPGPQLSGKPPPAKARPTRTSTRKRRSPTRYSK
jgi:hypothetical protein